MRRIFYNISLFPLQIYTALKPINKPDARYLCLFPLQIYTALKRLTYIISCFFSLFPLQIYTALKPFLSAFSSKCSLFPLQIYTALKPIKCLIGYFCGLFPLQIYTALKLVCRFIFTSLVCFPYKFTLLSNGSLTDRLLFLFVSPTNLHCSQTTRRNIPRHNSFVSPTNLHCSQTSNHSRKISAKYLRNIHSLLETLLF